MMKSHLSAVNVSVREAKLVMEMLEKAKGWLVASGHGLTAGTLSSKMEGVLSTPSLKPGESVLNVVTGVEGTVIDQPDDDVVVVAAKSGASLTGYTIDRWSLDVVMR